MNFPFYSNYVRVLTLTLPIQDTFSNVIMIFIIGAVSQGLGRTDGRRRRNVSKWAKMAVQVGTGVSKDTQFKYVEVLFKRSMIVS